MIQDSPREVGELLQVLRLGFEMLTQFVYFSTRAARILVEVFCRIKKQFMR